MWRFTIAACVTVFLAAGYGRSEDAGTAKRTAVLKDNSYWRVFHVMRDPIEGSEGKYEVIVTKESRKGRHYNTPLPASDWMSPDFDDGDWLRARGPFYPGTGFIEPKITCKQDARLALLCLRGRFNVVDPRNAGALELKLRFRGDARVYLNGREVARPGLPGGEIDMETPASDYSPDAWFKPGGGVIRWGFGDPGKFKDRCWSRVRSSDLIVLPTDLLRKGANVLAIEIHRAAHRKGERDHAVATWNTCGLHDLDLTAPAGAAVDSNISRPEGLMLWNSSTLQAAGSADYGDPNETLRAVRLVGARNAVVSGTVIAGADKDLAGIDARIDILRREGGTETIPAESISVRYPWPEGDRRRGMHYDMLCRTAPTGDSASCVQPVWVTVSVPAATLPGTYAGTLTIRALGKQKPVPIRLEVKPWKAPDPAEFVTWVDFISSPESVAMGYNTPLWSDEHMRKLGSVYSQLARIGNKTLYLLLVRETNQGNSETMVRWIRKPDGAFGLDFRPVERVVDTYLANAPKPECVVLYAWDSFLGGGYFGKGRKKTEGIGVSLLDEKTGKVSEYTGPKYTDTEQAVAFLKPLADGLRERLAARGLEDVMMVGMANDVFPVKEVVEVWKTLLPGAKWVEQGHGLHGSFHGHPIGYSTSVWNAGGTPEDPGAKREYGWRRAGQVIGWCNRDISHAPYQEQLGMSRRMPDWTMAGGFSGFGRLSADFWRVAPAGRGGRSIASRYPKSDWKQLNLTMTPYMGMGQAGAVATVRYEMMMEGLQETEARIVIEKTLRDKERRAELGDETAERLQKLLDDRTRSVICAGMFSGLGNDWYIQSGWKDRVGELFEAAALAAATMKGQ